MVEQVQRDKHDACGYQTTTMQKEMIIQKLKERGCRITKQRLMLLDIILKEECSCCKEIYFKASRQDSKVGAATVYRMINTLEEIGAISRKNMYKIACDAGCGFEQIHVVEFDDDTEIELSHNNWNQVIKAGLEQCGYLDSRKIQNVTTRTCECKEMQM